MRVALLWTHWHAFWDWLIIPFLSVILNVLLCNLSGHTALFCLSLFHICFRLNLCTNVLLAVGLFELTFNTDKCRGKFQLYHGFQQRSDPKFSISTGKWFSTIIQYYIHQYNTMQKSEKLRTISYMELCKGKQQRNRRFVVVNFFS